MAAPEGLAKRAAKAMLEGKYAEAATIVASLESHADQHALLDEVHALMERVAIDQGVGGRIDVDNAARGIDEIQSKLRAARPATVTSDGDARGRGWGLWLLFGVLLACAAAWFWRHG